MQIFIRPPGIKNNGSDFKDDRLNLFINELDRWDIICLQEMFGSFSKRQRYLISEAAKHGFAYHCASPAPSLLSTHIIDGKQKQFSVSFIHSFIHFCTLSSLKAAF
jgi:hypothetical protein